MSKKAKVQFISAMQIIGMILIVLSHSISQYASYPPNVGMFVQMIQQAGLTAFMWCSGYLFIYTGSVERYGYKKYIFMRAERLLIPHVVISLLMLAPKALVAKMQDSTLSVNVLHGFLCPRDGILPHLWFLPTLMIICLVAPIIQKGIISRKTACASLILLMCVAILPGIRNVLSINDVKTYLFWFTLGAVVAKYKNILEFVLRYKVIIAGASVLAYIAAFIYMEYSSLKWMICNICTLTELLLVGNIKHQYLRGGGTHSQYIFYRFRYRILQKS